MEHREDLIDSILGTAPYQLPPVIRAGGCYTLDVTYLGQNISINALSLEEALTRYLHFVTKAGYLIARRIDPLTDAPVRPGSNLPYSKNK